MVLQSSFGTEDLIILLAMTLNLSRLLCEEGWLEERLRWWDDY